MNYEHYIETIPDFPSQGVLFRDITPLLADGDAFSSACKELADFASKVGADVIVGPESRGFIFGSAVAAMLNKGFVPVRKPGKLPRETKSVSYDLEYGSNELHMHLDAIKPGQKVVILDDLLATGGTINATIELIKHLGGEVVGCGFMIELNDLKGRELLKDVEVISLLQY